MYPFHRLTYSPSTVPVGDQPCDWALISAGRTVVTDIGSRYPAPRHIVRNCRLLTDGHGATTDRGGMVSVT